MSDKDIYEAGRFLADRYAAGRWRGTGATPVPPMESLFVDVIGPSRYSRSVIGPSAVSAAVRGPSAESYSLIGRNP